MTEEPFLAFASTVFFIALELETFFALASTVLLLSPLDPDLPPLLDALLAIIIDPFDDDGSFLDDLVVMTVLWPFLPLLAGEVDNPWMDLPALEGTDMESDRLLLLDLLFPGFVA